jgi:PAS domain S-box-containing protein
MDYPLRILFVEDLPSDYELAVRELQKSSLQFTHTRVDTKDTLQKTIKVLNPDLVISDYSLPEFDGMEALKISLEYDAFLPFIILTGSMNEDTAVACMKAGATDYVIKEHMTRLPYAVMEALEQKKSLRAKVDGEIFIKKSEKKYRGIFENIQDVYFEASFEGIILEVSPSIEILTRGQYKREDLIDKSMTMIYYEKKTINNLLEVLSIDKRVLDYEVVFKNRDGMPIPCSLSSVIQFNDKNKPDKIIGTIRDVTERKKFDVLQLKRERELSLNQEATISSMAILAEYRDPETGYHIQRTKLYVKLLLEKSEDKFRFSPEIAELIWHSAPLHDIGKVGIPDNILLKPGKLTAEEFELMKKHTLIGGDTIRRTEKILGEVSFLNFAREITEFHHEKWNGSGYPHGLKENKIPLSARIMAIADVYDALVTRRPYKNPIPHNDAVEIIRKDSGIHFDPQLVDIFDKNSGDFDKIANQFKD